MNIDSLRNSRPVILPPSNSKRARDKQNKKSDGAQNKAAPPKNKQPPDGEVQHVDELV